MSISIVDIETGCDYVQSLDIYYAVLSSPIEQGGNVTVIIFMLIFVSHSGGTQSVFSVHIHT